MADEKTPLLYAEHDTPPPPPTPKPSFLKRIGSSVAGTFRIIVSTALAPGKWLVACFYDQDGNFSIAMPLHRIGRKLSRRTSKTARRDKIAVASNTPEIPPRRSSRRGARGYATGSDHDEKPSFEAHDADSSARQHRRRSASSLSGDESETHQSKRSIRINVIDDEALRRRKQKRASIDDGDPTQAPLTVDSIKSPTSPLSSASLTKYPRAPAPPRPLIPKRQPSYTSSAPPGPPQKTLIIDLDETLIHSMARGGRMSTGHMVEVKLDQPVDNDGKLLGPQVPILYYVHKRPFCDEFLRKVSKWYNLIVFTASVQQYADPVIDWLELERKYFSARYYRQHCTYRNGAFIKDLSLVEPDLSKVMILDNSPLSYILHEGIHLLLSASRSSADRITDNAIPIEGWISDPTDSDLLHLVPFLEGLQYATDVRALLALRLGESGAS